MYFLYNHIRRAVERDERNEHAEDRYEQEPLHLVTHSLPSARSTTAPANDDDLVLDDEQRL